MGFTLLDGISNGISDWWNNISGNNLAKIGYSPAEYGQTVLKLGDWDKLTTENQLAVANQFNQARANQLAQQQLAWAPVGLGLKGLSLGFDIFGQNRSYNLTKKMLDRQWEGYQKQFNNNVDLIERQIADQERTRNQFDPSYQPNYVHLARV